ncbi:hypothetical protein [Phenylobacterium sp.]|uniref:hypothetical protein n=1 Tax=Phenylobacterium sp. TaxID=1871053 RepID=UPI0026369D48|nr:hypothetical protein [Phenylobacterium sp.]
MAQSDHESSQADKFRDLARELECDEDEAAFKAAVKKIAQTPPQHREKPKGGDPQ